MAMELDLYFTDVFEVSENDLERYGAFNISLVTDLPLFIDPFLLFNSKKKEYQELHDNIINYLRFLKAKSEAGGVNNALLKAWYYFSEVKQNWLGFCTIRNTGRGLRQEFAEALNRNLVLVFKDFGNERITRGSHLEKLCLIKSGVGRDMISDFTTNLIKDFLLTYTEQFALKHISPTQRKSVAVSKSYFDYDLERWMPKTYVLPFYDGDYVILTPKDILTKDDTWINSTDMISNFEDIPAAVENDVLRAQINNYFLSMIPKKRKPKKDDYVRATWETLKKYPELMDYYIKMKEDNGDQALANSNFKVSDSSRLYVKQFKELVFLLNNHTNFYKVPGTTKEETKQKIEFLKDVIENKGGHRIFYLRGKPALKESDLHILYRLTWHRTPSDVSREVNDGRGPADFKISRGAYDKTLVEFKFASNPRLSRNLARQLDVYKKASDAETGYKVIVYFSKQELNRVKGIIKELKMERDPNIFLVDARKDNKPSASKA